jgi:DNA-directed RNA polymerase subunit RPC12/RpoP
MAHLLCDQCGLKFLRNIGKMNKKRLSNDFYHVCTNCDAKRFAQSKGVERRKIWNMSADADIDITKL